MTESEEEIAASAAAAAAEEVRRANRGSCGALAAFAEDVVKLHGRAALSAVVAGPAVAALLVGADLGAWRSAMEALVPQDQVATVRMLLVVCCAVALVIRMVWELRAYRAPVERWARAAEERVLDEHRRRAEVRRVLREELFGAVAGEPAETAAGEAWGGSSPRGGLVGAAVLGLLLLAGGGSAAHAQRIADVTSTTTPGAGNYVNLNEANMGQPHPLNNPASPNQWAVFGLRYNVPVWINLARDGVLLNSAMGHSIPVYQVCQVSYDQVSWTRVPCMGFEIAPRTAGTMDYLWYRLTAYSGPTTGAPAGYYDSGYQHVAIRVL